MLNDLWLVSLKNDLMRSLKSKLNRALVCFYSPRILYRIVHLILFQKKYQQMYLNNQCRSLFHLSLLFNPVFRLLFIPVILMLSKKQQKFDNYEKIQLFILLSVLLSMQLIGHGYNINNKAWQFELNFIINYLLTKLFHSIKLHNKPLIKSLKTRKILTKDMQN
jgi:hypothetical protein